MSGHRQTSWSMQHWNAPMSVNLCLQIISGAVWQMSHHILLGHDVKEWSRMGQNKTDGSQWNTNASGHEKTPGGNANASLQSERWKPMVLLGRNSGLQTNIWEIGAHKIYQWCHPHQIWQSCTCKINNNNNNSIITGFIFEQMTVAWEKREFGVQI